MSERTVVAFSGGLDTSWCVAWLRREKQRDVVTVTVDVGGFTAEDRQKLAERSRELGASQHILVDARGPFFHDVLRFLIMGNVTRGHLYPLCVGAERFLQAKVCAETARSIGARSIVHGCTAAGNDQVRFEVALRTLAPDLLVEAPIRDLAPSRVEEAAYLTAAGLEVPEKTTAYSVNTGLWGVTIGGKETTSTRTSIPEDAWVRTRGAFDRQLAPRTISLQFVEGVPVAVERQPLDAVSLIECVDKVAAHYGIGRGIHLGDTILGMKGRVAFEAPAATLLLAAHRELEKLVLTQEQQRIKDYVSQRYGELVHEGQFLDPACRDIEALLLSSQKRVTGTVHLLLRTGSQFVEGVESPFSLRDASKSVYGEAVGEWTPADAKGFSTIRALPSLLAARAHQSEKTHS